MKGKIMTLSLNTNEYHGRERIFYSMKLQKEHDNQAVGSRSSFQNNITNNFLNTEHEIFWLIFSYKSLKGFTEWLTNMNCVMSRLFALFRLYDKLNLNYFHALAYSCRKTVILGTSKRISRVIM